MATPGPGQESAPTGSDRPRRQKLARRRILQAGAVVAGSAVAVAAGGIAAYYGTRYSGTDPQKGWLAILHATALVGEELAAIPDATVLVRDGRIVEVGAGLGIPRDARVREATGATVLPGLIDMHTHLGFPDVGEDSEPGLTDWPGLLWGYARLIPDVRRSLLEHGVTSVRSLGDERELVAEMRDQIAHGELEGPRVFCSGPVFTTPGGHPIATFGLDAESDTIRLPGSPEEARRMVTELAEGEHVVDAIKVIQEGGVADLRLVPHAPEVLQEIVVAAHEHDLPVTAHCSTAIDIQSARDAGVDGIEHLSLSDHTATREENRNRSALAWPAGMLEQMAADDISLDPTLTVEIDRRAAENPDLVPLRDRIHARLIEAHEAGVRILAGSDAAVSGIPFGAGLIEEVENLATAGLGERLALRAATSHAAQALRSDEVGVLEPGRAADLLIVDGDPLDDIGALRQVRSVFRDGRLVVDR